MKPFPHALTELRSQPRSEIESHLSIIVWSSRIVADYVKSVTLNFNEFQIHIQDKISLKAVKPDQNPEQIMAAV